MLVAVPSDAPGGLDARIAEHFGHCEVFTLVELDGDALGAVTVVPNQEHSEGGCLAPVTLLKERGADALVTGGIGARPLAGFQQVGITVYQRGEAQTVREAVQGVSSGACRELGEQHSCGHGCSHDHHHHQEPTAGKVVDEPVHEGRFVQVSYRQTDEAGTLLDEADSIGYVHGAGQLVPGLERALEGRSAGERVEVKVTPADGYGERSDERMMKVPTADLPPGVTPGASLEAQLPNGMLVPLTVIAIDGDLATLDANHPLAGQTLCFDVRVLSVHEAVLEE